MLKFCRGHANLATHAIANYQGKLGENDIVELAKAANQDAAFSVLLTGHELVLAKRYNPSVRNDPVLVFFTREQHLEYTYNLFACDETILITQNLVSLFHAILLIDQ